MNFDETALQEHFAFQSNQTLSECCDTIRIALGLPAFKLDSENETEWGCAESSYLEYNVSRPFDSGTLQRWDPSVPKGCNFGLTLVVSRCHPLADYPERLVSEVAWPLAQALANALGVTICYHRSWRGPGSNLERSDSFAPTAAV